MGNRGSFAVTAVALLVLAAAAGLGLAALFSGAGTSNGTASGSGGTSSASASGTAAGTAAAGKLTLQADKSSAGKGERVNLTGRLTGAGSGVTLQVQRQSGTTWAQFPATARTKSNGEFSTFVMLGRSGKNVVRVIDPSSGTTSDPVTIEVS